MRQHPPGIRFDAVYASPLSRALDTARLIRPDADIATADNQETGSSPNPFILDNDVVPSPPAEVSASARQNATPPSMQSLAPEPQLANTWPAVAAPLYATVQHALASPDGHADELIAELDAAQAELLAIYLPARPSPADRGKDRQLRHCSHGEPTCRRRIHDRKESIRQAADG